MLFVILLSATIVAEAEDLGIVVVGDLNDPLPGSPYRPEQFRAAGIKLVETLDEMAACLTPETSYVGVVTNCKDRGKEGDTTWILDRIVHKSKAYAVFGTPTGSYNKYD